MAILLTTNSAYGPSNTGGITFYSNSVTLTQPSQQKTIGQAAIGNAGFYRNWQLTDNFLLTKRGTTTVAIPLADLASIVIGQAPGLSYSPLIVLQPQALSIVAGLGNYATFNTAANSESALTYGWAVNNGVSWVTNVSNRSNNGANQYSLVSPTSLKITPASNSPSKYLVLCSVVNATGTTNTSQATLTVL